MRRNVAGTLLWVVWAALPCLAHELSTSYSEIRVEGAEARIAFTINATELHNGPIVDADGNGEVTSGELDAAIGIFTDAVLYNYRVSLPDREPTVPERTGYRLMPGNLVRLDLLYRFESDATDMTVVSSLDAITQENHRHLLQIGDGDQTRQTVLSRDHPQVDIDYTMGIPVWVTMFEFVALGIEHIGTGYDHLAFLLGLLLAAGTLLSLTKVVTAFTVGHSVTLVLATLGVVTIPSRLVESLIALSIAYVAVENFMGRQFIHRWVITFFFGLIHGFGFSNVLREFGLSSGRLAVSLFSFNAGVEVGQLAFVAVAFPVLWYLGRSQWREHVLAAGSVLIMSLGFYWFVQRAVFG